MEPHNLSLVQALVLARGACEPGCVYDPRFCPRYWRRVFVLYFGNEPSGDTDPRWDELFKFGFPARRALLKEETLIKAAS